MKIRCVWEHNGDDSLLYAADLPGAYTRGETLESALSKMNDEIKLYSKWSRSDFPVSEIVIVQEKCSTLNIKDADSDVIFDMETVPLDLDEYKKLKELALKSASDFKSLFDAIPDKNASDLRKRVTFYGEIPVTAGEMYEHTKNVNSYYFGEINIEADNEGDIFSCRNRGFEALEKQESFLKNEVVEGSYGELWSLRKLLRRFIWHDRIHAKAMYRMALRTFKEEKMPNPFFF